MKKKMICLLLVLMWILTLAGCGKRTVTCDHCGKDIQVRNSSNVTDEWTLYCSSCETELFGKDGLIVAD